MIDRLRSSRGPKGRSIVSDHASDGSSPQSVCGAKSVPEQQEAKLVSPSPRSKIEQLLELGNGIIRALDAVPNGARVFVDLVVVASLIRLVSEEVNGGVLDAQALLVLNMLETVSLVPAAREDVKGDLAAD